MLQIVFLSEHKSQYNSGWSAEARFLCLTFWAVLVSETAKISQTWSIDLNPKRRGIINIRLLFLEWVLQLLLIVSGCRTESYMWPFEYLGIGILFTGLERLKAVDYQRKRK